MSQKTDRIWIHLKSPNQEVTGTFTRAVALQLIDFMFADAAPTDQPETAAGQPKEERRD